jgi:aminoglycoside phosphotransferase (APT) family kinase protein
MLREYTIMNKIKPAFSAVPETFFYTDDESILGSEFYLMEKVEGCSVSNQIPASWGFGATENHQLAMAMFDKLIELHQVDYTALDLAGFGRPEGYVRRQIEGWTMRFEKALTDDVEAFTDVREWLLDRIPDKENKPAILHGDFRIDNMIVDADNPFHVKAVLDWEISALGDPLMDLANALAYWVQADDSAALKAFAIQPSDADGMPTRAELLEYYGTKTGIDISQFDFYAVYGYFRNAVILQQIYYRYYHGQTSDKRFANFSAGVNALCQHCRVLIAASRL